MHTPLCKHAFGDPGEYAATAARNGLKGIVFTCHAPLPDDLSPQVRMDITEFETYVELVACARDDWAGRIDVLLGLESDFLPGLEDWLGELHERAEFHHILGSIHPHLPEYYETYFTGDAMLDQQIYFKHLAMAAESGLFDTLSHPDLIKNLFPKKWQVTGMLDHIRESLDRIAATAVAMELNTSGLYKSVREMNPGPTMLLEMQQRGIPVVLGSDSHQPLRVGDAFDRGLDLLAEAGYTEVSYFLHRERQTLPIATVRESLHISDWQLG